MAAKISISNSKLETLLHSASSMEAQPATANKLNPRPIRIAPKRYPQPAPNGSADQRPAAAAAASTIDLADMEDFSMESVESIRARLLRWYDEHQRVLPWRTASSRNGGDEEGRAYAVWVSEMMLQQTRVQTVIDYYNRWMEKWPTIEHLAAATQEEVNEMWAGLGYYRRARFLLEGAKSIVKGKFPQTVSDLLKVCGIGDYTAGAIASIAFNEAVPVVDGNVIRVISRLKTISSNPRESATIKKIWSLAAQLVDPMRPGDFNQAMMELGATLCSTTSPCCSICPVSSQCFAFSQSKQEGSIKVTNYPTKVAKVKKRSDFAAVCVLQLNERVDEAALKGSTNKEVFLMIKRPEEGLLAGLWEFPSVLLEEKETDVGTRRTAIDKYLDDLLNIDLRMKCDVISREDVGSYVHIFSHIRLHMHIELLILSPKGGSTQLYINNNQSKVACKFVDGDSLRSIGLTSGIRKVYNMIEVFKQKKLEQIPKAAPKKRSRSSKK